MDRVAQDPNAPPVDYNDGMPPGWPDWPQVQASDEPPALPTNADTPPSLEGPRFGFPIHPPARRALRMPLPEGRPESPLYPQVEPAQPPEEVALEAELVWRQRLASAASVGRWGPGGRRRGQAPQAVSTVPGTPPREIIDMDSLPDLGTTQALTAEAQAEASGALARDDSAASSPAGSRRAESMPVPVLFARPDPQHPPVEALNAWPDHAARGQYRIQRSYIAHSFPHPLGLRHVLERTRFTHSHRTSLNYEVQVVHCFPPPNGSGEHVSMERNPRLFVPGTGCLR